MEGEDLSRAPMAPESESLPYRLVNTNTIEITIYTYELEKHFKDGGKLISCPVTSTASMLNFVLTSHLVIIFQYCIMSDEYIQTYLVCS